MTKHKKRPVTWSLVKYKCKVGDETIRKARELGMSPRTLIASNASRRDEPWKIARGRLGGFVTREAVRKERRAARVRGRWHARAGIMQSRAWMAGVVSIAPAPSPGRTIIPGELATSLRLATRFTSGGMIRFEAEDGLGATSLSR
jgi:hypothetical protein